MTSSVFAQVLPQSKLDEAKQKVLRESACEAGVPLARQPFPVNGKTPFPSVCKTFCITYTHSPDVTVYVYNNSLNVVVTNRFYSAF